MRPLLICFALTFCILISGKTPGPDLKWELGYLSDSLSGEWTWVTATVPGAIQLDIAKAEKYGPWYYAENWKDYSWMEDRYFHYRTDFEKPFLEPGERLFFFSAGIDYSFEILLNGTRVFEQEGMFTPVKIDLTEKLQNENLLVIIIHPIPKSRSFPVDRSQADHSVKPAVSYGWDWHPRLVPSGIWDETGLVIEQESRVEVLSLDYTLGEKLDQALISFRITGQKLYGRNYAWTLTDEKGTPVLKDQGTFAGDSVSLQKVLNSPELWWPHDQGRPYLYTSSLQLLADGGQPVMTHESKVGFRRVKLVMNQGTESDPAGFPKSRRLPPIQLEINGRRIFCKGTNWVNPEVFPGIIMAARYEELIDRALEANFNIFRIWGGGIVNKESFYELCDRKGILVWQEFPLACNNYPDESHYLKILEQESNAIIGRLKKHPCLALWCGGNELYNSWSGMNDQSLALRLLNSRCFELDPQTPFLPTSPLEGMGHGHYVFRDMDSREEVYARMNRSRFTAYTEFGMPAPAAVAILKSIIPAGELWPPAPGTSWESHHAYHAWIGNTWLMQEMIEDYFGKSDSLGELVSNGQLLQGEGYKYIFEEARRQKPYCAMALNWCYNEPWPAAANNSLISWPNVPKPGYYEVRNACRPVLASATIQKFVWKRGETFISTVWILNDSPQPVEQGRVTISIVRGKEKLTLGKWEFSEIKANENLKGLEFSTAIPDWTAGQFRLVLEVEDKPELNSEYVLLVGRVTSDELDK